jgi:hypothetical protein
MTESSLLTFSSTTLRFRVAGTLPLSGGAALCAVRCSAWLGTGQVVAVSGPVASSYGPLSQREKCLGMGEFRTLRVTRGGQGL